MIIMDSVVIPRPPALPPGPLVKPAFLPKDPKQNDNFSNGFRLISNGANEDLGDTGSVYSIYKQKIDSMFESDSSSNINNEHSHSDTKNSVQARIEKMFSDVAKDSAGTVPFLEGVHSFSVDYLGSVSLCDKVTSLAGLQDPLKNLYFAYKRTTRNKKSLTGRLEISSQGLKVQYQGDKGDLEQMNSFPTIAVWSAVKFVIVTNDPKQQRYAFLPLITDPDNIDKKSLFRNLDNGDQKYITREAHSPLFAVVMRKIGVQKQLECHGFVCQTSEDAIVIAATLYKSLMSHMKAKEKKPKSRNGITCMSIASSTTYNADKNPPVPVRPPRKKRSTTSSIASESNDLASDTQPLIPATKKSTKTRRAPKAPLPLSQDFDAIVPYEEPIKIESTKEVPPEIIKPKTFTDKLNTYMSREQKQITAEIKQVMSESTNRGLKHVVRNNDEDKVGARKSVGEVNSGDILTKVTIPRSGSFLNAGGLTRYKSKSSSNGQVAGGSPLGFNELFNEFRLQEGLHSMDEILGVIIDPEGMSFNDLKPIYKEFLLKLSVTLTKDELYQRSKSIMRRQKKKILRNSIQNKQQSHHIITGGKFKRLKHIFRKNLRLRLGNNNKNLLSGPLVEEQKKHRELSKESSISTSSYDTRQFTPKESTTNNKESNNSNDKKTCRHTSNIINKQMRRDRTSTSEESDFFSISRRRTNKLLHHQHNNRNSSSGYVSCSECSYDSDTCTCTSADKCYCSLNNTTENPKNIPKKLPGASQKKCDCQDIDVSFCGCDTDSCAESNKCYCQASVKTTSNTAMFTQLMKKREHHHQHKKICKKFSNSKSTRSLEYMHNPIESYYEKLASGRISRSTRSCSGRNNLNGRYGATRRKSSSGVIDYEIFGLQEQEQHNNRLTDEAFHHHKGHKAKASSVASIRSYGSSKYGIQNSRRPSTTTISGPTTEALSVKKSAEIAALFADIKLSQTTDIAHMAPAPPMPPPGPLPTLMMMKKTGIDIKAIASSGGGVGKVGLFSFSSLSSNLNSNNKCSNKHSGGYCNNVKNNKMYSAKNGLYTIQSQSDESRRSSMSESRLVNKSTKHQRVEQNYFGGPNFNKKNIFNIGSGSSKMAALLSSHNSGSNNNLENSLGYLP